MTILRFLGGLHYAPLSPAGILLVQQAAGGGHRVIGSERDLKAAVHAPAGRLALAPWTGEAQDLDPAPVIAPSDLRGIMPAGFPGAELPWILPSGPAAGGRVHPPAASGEDGSPRHRLNLLIMHHRQVAAVDPVAGRIALNILDVVGLQLG